MKQPVVYQRLESVAIFLTSIYFYYSLRFSLLLFVLFLFSFDVFMAGYLVNDKVGARMYNIGHSLSAPLLLLIIGVVGGSQAAIGVSLIWLAHIGLDRALGYGLKF